nr:glycosyltransferase family 2 protein [Pseudorhodobacter aquimaris]
MESSLAASDVLLEIVVVDNASTDDTVAQIRSWTAGTEPYCCPDDSPVPGAASSKQVMVHSADAPLSDGRHHITLFQNDINLGFAGRGNLGLLHLATRAEIDRFWIFNPDSVVTPQTPSFFVNHSVTTGWALMAGRLFYYDLSDVIQNDGGTINRFTGVTSNLNLFAKGADTPPALAEQMQFVSGASRKFYETIGPMNGSYFRHHEEVDWALRHRTLKLVNTPDGVVYHKAGTASVSPSLGHPASPFLLHFKHRARLRFIKHIYPLSLPVAGAFTLAKAAQLALTGFKPEAVALLNGGFEMPPPAAVRDRLRCAGCKVGIFQKPSSLYSARRFRAILSI